MGRSGTAAGCCSGARERRRARPGALAHCRCRHRPTTTATGSTLAKKKTKSICMTHRLPAQHAQRDEGPRAWLLGRPLVGMRTAAHTPPFFRHFFFFFFFFFEMERNAERIPGGAPPPGAHRSVTCLRARPSSVLAFVIAAPDAASITRNRCVHFFRGVELEPSRRATRPADTAEPARR